jgi:hypothetical protein
VSALEESAPKPPAFAALRQEQDSEEGDNDGFFAYSVVVLAM